MSQTFLEVALTPVYSLKFTYLVTILNTFLRPCMAALDNLFGLHRFSQLFFSKLTKTKSAKCPSKGQKIVKLRESTKNTVSNGCTLVLSGGPPFTS